jgi:hypothetical protein
MYVTHPIKSTSVPERTLFVYGINKEKLVALPARDQDNMSAASSRVQPQLTFDDYNPRKQNQ